MADPAAPDAQQAQAAAPSAGIDLLKITQWAVGALAAAGSFAVAKLSLDRLGRGDYSGGRLWLALGAIAAFTIGAAVLVMAVVWVARAGRVTMAALQSAKRGPTKKARDLVERSKYLLNGADSLQAFKEDLDRRIVERAAGPTAFQANEDQRVGLTIALSARQDILATARAERISGVNAMAAWLMLGGSLLAAFGAALFGYVTNEADKVFDASKPLPAAAVDPSGPWKALLVVPATVRAEAAEWLGTDCDLDGVSVLVLEFATPPGDDATRVAHVVSQRTATCRVADMWVEPGWLAAPPAAGTADTPKEPAPPTT